ncbi:MAG: tRNA (adenosine(37)-N6)-threonylcarbamoyltransferase complex dimerization subunit type 1 TsaB [Pseudomonadales bacterium]|nr:tRNA (adenosine(37)-N6)-threonylcarbamoyltransferase complex dimerization subunit type 1 TsaB [Pseudomonadales bacterium]
MISLAIDTGSAAISLGLQIEGEVYEDFEIISRSHSREILPRLQRLLESQGVTGEDIDLIAFGKGPGSFTGLRIGVGVVQGLAYGLGVPVAPVSTLAVMAQGCYRTTGAENIIVALTAREDELFYGTYQIVDGHAVLHGSEAVERAGALPPLPSAIWSGIGSGWVRRAEMEASLGFEAESVRTEVYPRAEDLIQLAMMMHQKGQLIDALEARPEYLREQVATPS